MYEGWLGQKHNFEKYAIHFSININMSRIGLEPLSVQIMKNDEKYLGTYMFMEQLRKSSYNFVVNKFISKLKDG